MLRYEAVRLAYANQEADLRKTVFNTREKNLFALREVYFRVFRKELRLEVWGRFQGSNAFVFLKQMPLCSAPLVHDRQPADGYFQIEHWIVAPETPAEEILETAGRLVLRNGKVNMGGSCSDVEYLSLSSKSMEELFVIATEARENGQLTIPVHVFPTYMDAENLKELRGVQTGNISVLRSWDVMQEAYDYFERNRTVPVFAGLPTPVANAARQPEQPVYGEPGNSLVTSVTVTPTGGPLSGQPLSPVHTPASPVQREAFLGQAPKTHTVSEGQTLYAISRMYGVTVDDLKAWNNLRNNTIYMDQVLKITKEKVHVVQKGDTLYAIARNNGVSVTQLRHMNNKDGNLIVPGEKLVIAL